MQKARPMTAVLLLGLCACGRTEPPTVVDVTGNYAYTVALIGPTWQCALPELTTLVLTQTGTIVNGTIQGLTVSCFGPATGLLTKQFGTVQVVNGKVNGAAISFDFNPSGFKHTGTVNVDPSSRPRILTGGVNVTLNLGAPAGTLTFTNSTWQAIR